MRAEITTRPSSTMGARSAAAAQPDPVELIAELASAGLVSIDMSDAGDTYALTPQGQRSAQLMAMSRGDHALVLLGAFMGATGARN